MIKIVQFDCKSESAPAKYNGTIQTDRDPNLFCDFYFYFKHGHWEFELFCPETSFFKEGEIGHKELDDMNKTVATSLITYALAETLGETEIVWALREK